MRLFCDFQTPWNRGLRLFTCLDIEKWVSIHNFHGVALKFMEACIVSSVNFFLELFWSSFQVINLKAQGGKRPVYIIKHVLLESILTWPVGWEQLNKKCLTPKLLFQIKTRLRSFKSHSLDPHPNWDLFAWHKEISKKQLMGRPIRD